MKKTRTTVLNDTLRTQAEDGVTSDLRLEVFEDAPEDETPYQIGIGCQSIFLFDADLRKIVKMCNAALRIRKAAVLDKQRSRNETNNEFCTQRR